VGRKEKRISHFPTFFSVPQRSIRYDTSFDKYCRH